MKMHSVRTSLIAVALVAVFAATPAIAQEDYGNVGSQSLRAKRDAERAKKAAAQKASEPVAAQYPQATRQEPETIATKEGLKKLTEVQKLYEAQDYANAIARAGAIAADASSNAYEKAFAHQLAASAAAASGDDAAAAKNFEQALAANGLDNNNHYTVMFNLAVTQYGLGQNEQALQTVDRFLSETKSDKPEAQTLRGGILMALERYDEAGKFYDALLAAHPDDKSIRMNAVAAYQQSNQPDKAVALLAAAQAKGQLTEASEYRALYVSYINADQDKQALAVIDDGIAKGVIKPGADLAKDYMVLGQKAYYASDLATAIQMYGRAAPMAADGEAALNLAKVYAEAGKPAEAKAAAQQALDKGVKDTAAANKLLGGG